MTLIHTDFVLVKMIIYAAVRRMPDFNWGRWSSRLKSSIHSQGLCAFNGTLSNIRLTIKDSHRFNQIRENPRYLCHQRSIQDLFQSVVAL